MDEILHGLVPDFEKDEIQNTTPIATTTTKITELQTTTTATTQASTQTEENNIVSCMVVPKLKLFTQLGPNSPKFFNTKFFHTNFF